MLYNISIILHFTFPRVLTISQIYSMERMNDVAQLEEPPETWKWLVKTISALACDVKKLFFFLSLFDIFPNWNFKPKFGEKMEPSFFDLVSLDKRLEEERLGKKVENKLHQLEYRAKFWDEISQDVRWEWKRKKSELNIKWKKKGLERNSSKMWYD